MWLLCKQLVSFLQGTRMSGNIFIKLKPYQAVASTRLVRVAEND